jgi:branched-chain amino acid transport system ATP-binding protein
VTQSWDAARPGVTIRPLGFRQGSGIQPLPPCRSCPTSILETRRLVKEFKGFVAVNDVSLRVQRGRIHALIGPNGAGKTTCFNLLDQVPSCPPADRSCSTVTTSRPESRPQTARRGIIRSFQISAVFPHLTVLENVRVALQRNLGTSFHFWKPQRSLRSRSTPGRWTCSLRSI